MDGVPLGLGAVALLGLGGVGVAGVLVGLGAAALLGLGGVGVDGVPVGLGAVAVAATAVAFGKSTVFCRKSSGMPLTGSWLLDDAIDRRQTQPGPLACPFGRVEGFENLLQLVFVSCSC